MLQHQQPANGKIRVDYTGQDKLTFSQVITIHQSILSILRATRYSRFSGIHPMLPAGAGDPQLISGWVYSQIDQE
ncbi:hypothetical protein [Bacillus salacetis]|uniref:hypothetical protein n=1 Tax=Bacillus salacetis TaxID=2315464 RepID=UPI00109B7C31|nr:hypothetical protein [Bacillus salacetis]